MLVVSDEIGALDESKVPQEVSGRLTEIVSRCDDAENKLRRSSMLFYGIKKEPNEWWQMSEKMRIYLYVHQMDPTPFRGDIERAVLEGVAEENNRPIIIKLTRFKDKGSVLSVGNKLKGTECSIHGDF